MSLFQDEKPTMIGRFFNMIFNMIILGETKLRQYLSEMSIIVVLFA